MRGTHVTDTTTTTPTSPTLAVGDLGNSGVAPDPVRTPHLDDRGALVVREKAAQRIAQRATTGTDGVLVSASSGPFGRLAARELPRVRVAVSSGRARVRVDIAVGWGRSVEEVGTAVRRNVSEALTELGGLAVHGVDVAVARIVPERANTGEGPE